MSEQENYLTKFKAERKPEYHGFEKNVSEIGEKIVELLKKEELTYAGAYASLQYAYDLIKFESNFLKIKNPED